MREERVAVVVGSRLESGVGERQRRRVGKGVARAADALRGGGELRADVLLLIECISRACATHRLTAVGVAEREAVAAFLPQQAVLRDDATVAEVVGIRHGGAAGNGLLRAAVHGVVLVHIDVVRALNALVRRHEHEAKQARGAVHVVGILAVGMTLEHLVAVMVGEHGRRVAVLVGGGLAAEGIGRIVALQGERRRGEVGRDVVLHVVLAVGDVCRRLALAGGVPCLAGGGGTEDAVEWIIGTHGEGTVVAVGGCRGGGDVVKV